jgi:hypothetical protein
LEPLHVLDGLIIARCVDEPCAGTIKTTVINTTNKPRELVQGQIIGKIYLAELRLNSNSITKSPNRHIRQNNKSPNVKSNKKKRKLERQSRYESSSSSSPSSSRSSYQDSSTSSCSSNSSRSPSSNSHESPSSRLNEGKIRRLADANNRAGLNLSTLGTATINRINKLSVNTKTTCVKKIPSADALSQELQKIINKKINDLKVGLRRESKEYETLRQLIAKNHDVFSWDDFDMGCTSVTEHEINTGSAKPIKQMPYKCPAALKTIMEQQIERMQKQGIIRESNSPWASPVVMVRKKGGDWRFCVDYRKLNAVTQKDAFPLARMDESIQVLNKAKYFSVLDLASGYWQVKVKEEDRHKTAFVTFNGLWEFNVMSFGLTNAPATFQRTLNHVLKGLTWKQCLVYLDDVICFSHSFEEHIHRLENIFARFREHGLKINPNKCSFAQNKVTYLGHELSDKGCRPDPLKVVAITNIATPTNTDELHRFLGMMVYQAKYIPHFSSIANPLFALMKKNVRFNWTVSCEEAFNELKNRLSTAPVLIYPDFSDTFYICADASGTGLGAVLYQRRQGEDRPIAFASKMLTDAEKSYNNSEREALGVRFRAIPFP